MLFGGNMQAAEKCSNRHSVFLAFTFIFLFYSFSPQTVHGVQSGELRYYATLHSIGIEWDVSDDANHNAECLVSYKLSSSSEWRDALPLFRVDFNSDNMVAGSILYLEPGRSYDVSLELRDRDGGSFTRNFSVSTLELPTPPIGRTLYVIPGAGGGSGTISNPYRGIAAAQAHVEPGDTVMIGGGTYAGETEFTVSGQPGNYIVWKGRGNGRAVVETIRVNGDHLWFENLDVEGNEYGIRTYNSPHDIVVSKNRFTGCHYCIYLNHGGSSWYIADNIITGDVDPASGQFGGEGVELSHSDNHTVVFNSISKVADGISYPGRNCDIFGNEIFDVSDDGIEPDYGRSNNRIYSNRISNAYHNGISFQPMNGSPWYILRNQVAAPVESALKFRDSVDRALIAHNTFVGWRGVQKSGSEHLLAVMSRNNLWISMEDWYAWENSSGGTADWRTDLDYDGFDWGNNMYGFKWGARYTDLAAFTQATGLEPNGIRVNKDSCFTAINIPHPPPSSMSKQHFTLKSGCGAVDSGAVLTNINEDYRGSAPDLGAHETGAPLQHYGPRLITSPPPPPTPEGGAVPPSLHLLLTE